MMVVMAAVCLVDLSGPWGLNQLGVAFSVTFTTRLLQVLDGNIGERMLPFGRTQLYP